VSCISWKLQRTVLLRNRMRVTKKRVVGCVNLGWQDAEKDASGVVVTKSVAGQHWIAVVSIVTQSFSFAVTGSYTSLLLPITCYRYSRLAELFPFRLWTWKNALSRSSTLMETIESGTTS
jgi:hypothetical protein